MNRILGAVLAGGRSRRFGADKALAHHAGRALIDHAIGALAGRTDAVIVCGRDHAGAVCVPDRPGADLGPLGGINAALGHARDHGFGAVLTVGCDTPLLPDDLLARLASLGAPAVVDRLPIIGLWPVSLAGALEDYLMTSDDRSLRAWTARCGARRLTQIPAIANINTRADLIQLDADHARPPPLA